ncbi:MAG: class I SAM-dependent methyltransferase [Actinobacteria bacterium]|nr:class I SAM-dependent methyltransferase [Actinomycetota bacterium]MBU1944540.1 class I SAM-dependent methyltransferase [Actinomycetota bacterium]MBU2689093.1 class I SAM-dependent methyltransferase [Actinomycetota bacterium]
MRESIKQFVQICVEEFGASEPVFEFGSLQVPGQEGFADLRPFFRNMQYVGFDIREGPGVDVVLDLLDNNLPDESAGTVLIMDTLEHVEYPRQAIEEAFRILRPNGLLLISSVMNYVIHGYPNDYWRFTPEGFKSLLQQFPHSFVGFAGDARFPHTVVGLGLKDRTIPMVGFQRRYESWKAQWRYFPFGRSWKTVAILLAPAILVDMYRKARVPVQDGISPSR